MTLLEQWVLGGKKKNLLNCEWSVASLGEKWVCWVAVNNKLLSFFMVIPLFGVLYSDDKRITAGWVSGSPAAHTWPHPKVTWQLRWSTWGRDKCVTGCSSQGDPVTIPGSALLGLGLQRGAHCRLGCVCRWGGSLGWNPGLITLLYLE